MLRRFFILCAVFALALPAVAPARTLDEIIKSGTIRVGVNPNFPPMSSYGKTNALEGFDIDVARAVAAGARRQGRVRDDRDASSACRFWFPTASTSRSARSPARRAREAHLVHRAAAQRSDGRDHDGQGSGPELAGPEQERDHAGQHARQLSVDVLKGKLPNRQGAAGGRQRRHDSRDRAGPRRRAGREHRLLPALHQATIRT